MDLRRFERTRRRGRQERIKRSRQKVSPLDWEGGIFEDGPECEGKSGFFKEVPSLKPWKSKMRMKLSTKLQMASMDSL